MYAKRLALVETIDQMVDSQMELSPGMAVLAMVLDTLSGRTPLYRLPEFFAEKDVELLLGAPIPLDRFGDTNEGRVELCGRTYRAIVVHSSAHDQRRHKRIDRMLEKER